MTIAKCLRCGASATSTSYEKARLLIDHAAGLSRGIPCGDNYNFVKEIKDDTVVTIADATVDTTVDTPKESSQDTIKDTTEPTPKADTQIDTSSSKTVEINDIHKKSSEKKKSKKYF